MSTYKFLHLAHFKDIPNWSVQYADNEDLGFTKKYPMARIGSFLVKSNDIIDVQDDVEYRQVTLKINNGGVVPRNDGKTLKGSKIGTKRQHVVHAGQFIMSKIDARNGAYGIVPEELEGAIVTNDFPVFDVDESKIITQFLVLVSTTEKFIGFARKCSSGTTNRKRIDIDAFLNQLIPLPSIEEQKIILDEYSKKINISNEAYNDIDKLTTIQDSYLHNKLEFEYYKDTHTGLLNYISFSRINRWDVQYYSANHIIISKYETTTIGASLDSFMQDGKASLRIDTNKYPNKQFHYIGMEHVQKGSGCLVELPVVKGSEIKSQTVRVPYKFLIYGKLRPYLNKYWVNDTKYEDVICSSEFFCFKPKDCFNLDFYKYILSSYIIQDQISTSTTGARMPRIDEKLFKGIVIPIPPLNKQMEIANYLNGINELISSLKENAKNMRDEAFDSFKKTLFER